MPWVKVGRHKFDLDAVVLVSDVVGSSGEAGDGVTITLSNRARFNLTGEQAEWFNVAFDEHATIQYIGRPRDWMATACPSPAVHAGDADS